MALGCRALWTQNELMIRLVQKEEQKKLLLRQCALEMSWDITQNMVAHGSITSKMMTLIVCFDHNNNNCYYSSSEPVTYDLGKY